MDRIIRFPWLLTCNADATGTAACVESPSAQVLFLQLRCKDVVYCTLQTICGQIDTCYEYINVDLSARPYFCPAEGAFKSADFCLLRQCLSPNGLVLNDEFLGPDAGEKQRLWQSKPHESHALKSLRSPRALALGEVSEADGLSHVSFLNSL